MKKFFRYLIVNLCCVGGGAVAAVYWQGAAVVPALLFVLLIVWVSNEAWNWVTVVPTAGSALPGGTGPGERRRASLLLLIVPHAVFAVLYVINRLLDNLVSLCLGVELTHGLFACAYAAVVLLWIAAVFHVVAPLSLAMLVSVEAACARRLPEGEPAEGAAGMPGVCGCAPKDEQTPMDEEGGSAESFLPSNPQLLAVRDELLYYGRPNQGSTYVYVRKNVILGSCLVVVVLLLLGAGVRVYPYSPLGASLCGVMAVMLAGVSISELSLPSRWNKRLSYIEFAVTRTWIYIVDGEDVCALPLDKELKVQYEEVEGDVGTIYFDHPVVHATFLGRLMAKIRFMDVQHTADFSAQLRGFFQIARARQVYELIREIQRER